MQLTHTRGFHKFRLKIEDRSTSSSTHRLPHASPSFCSSIEFQWNFNASSLVVFKDRFLFTVTSELKLENIFADSSMQSSNSSTDDQKDYPVRKLEQSDKEKGFIELLRQLTVCDSVSDKDFNDRFEEVRSYGDDHLICVIEDKKTGKIVATGSLFVEKKFIRNCGKVGHVEDVVVDSNARGLQLGKKIVGFLADHARAMGCYKVILDCSTENQTFYEKCGFKQKEIQMVKYFT